MRIARTIPRINAPAADRPQGRRIDGGNAPVQQAIAQGEIFVGGLSSGHARATASEMHPSFVQREVEIDYPKEHERIRGATYTVNLKPVGNVKQAYVSIDGHEFKAAREAVGRWWFDWAHYPVGLRKIRAKSLEADNREQRTEERTVAYIPVGAITVSDMIDKVMKVASPGLLVELKKDTELVEGLKSRPRFDWFTRALSLMADPSLLYQGVFGICGVVSILRHMLGTDIMRFLDLAKNALKDDAFVANWLRVFQTAVRSPAQQGKELEFIVAQWLVHNHFPGEQKLSHTRVRPEGRSVEEKTKEKLYEQFVGKQKAFTEQWTKEELPGYLEGGHFAMTPGGASYLLGAATGRKSYKIRLEDFKDVSEAFNLAKSKAGGSPIMAGVRGVEFYTSLEPPVKEPARKPPQKIIHWIVVDNFKATDAELYFEIWTWGRKYVTRVSKKVVASWIHSLVVAEK